MIHSCCTPGFRGINAVYRRSRMTASWRSLQTCERPVLAGQRRSRTVLSAIGSSRPIAGVRDRRLWSDLIDLIDVFSDNHCDQTSLKIAHNFLGGAHPPFRARQPGRERLKRYQECGSPQERRMKAAMAGCINGDDGE